MYISTNKADRRKRLLRAAKTALCALGLTLLPANAAAQGWPAQYKGVMLQGFYWDSYDDSSWSNLTKQADELSKYFSLVWIPQSAWCGGLSMGYNDLYWFSHYDSSFGTEAQLRTMINTFNQKGIGTIADVVINHRGTLKGWFDFPTETYHGKTYTMTAADVCANDDDGKAAAQAQKEGVSLSSHNDTGEGWDGMRDLDHYSTNVQNTVKDYLHMLLEDLKYAGFRYDMVKGYTGNFTGMYNADAKPTYSVGEYFDGNKQSVINWINSTKVDGVVQSAAFDFPLRYSIRDAANNGNWQKLAGGGVATSPANKRYAVTFIENHDTEQRSSDNQQDPIRKDTLAANAFLLAMPGTPCVFYKHWIDCKQDLKNMIMLRNLVGINNQSSSTRKESTAARYALATAGTKGVLWAVVGSTASSYAAPSGYALAAEGYHWRYFIEKTQEVAWPSLASGVYYNTPEVTLHAISATSGAKLVYTLDGTEPTASSTQVAAESKVKLPTGNTTLKVGLLINGKVSGVQTREYEVRSFTQHTISVYVNADKVGWNNVYFWTWGGDGTHGPTSTAWPGDNVTKTTQQYGKKWFVKDFTLNSPTDFVSFVFAKDKDTQTVNFTGVTADTYIEISSELDASNHYLVNDLSAEVAGITNVAAGVLSARPTVVVSVDGRVVRRFAGHVAEAEALQGLAKGIYAVNGKKVVVR